MSYYPTPGAPYVPQQSASSGSGRCCGNIAVESGPCSFLIGAYKRSQCSMELSAEEKEKSP